MDREGELYKSDVDDPGEICPEAIEAADLIDDAIELARISGNWEGTYTSIMATVDNAIRKANSIPPEEVEPPGALLRDVIDYAEGGKVLEPWMVRGLISLRAQLAERTGEREALAQISQLERQIPYASAHGFVEYSLKKIGNLARAALGGKDSK